MKALAAEFGGSVKAEVLKLRKRPSTWVIALILILFVVLLDYGLSYLVFKTAPRRLERSGETLQSLITSTYPINIVRESLSDVSGIGACLALILGALSMSSEYEWRTLRAMFTQAPGRLTVLAAKAAVLVPVAAILSVMVLAAAALSSLGVGSLDGHVSGWPAVSQAVGGFLAVWLILSVWVALGVLLGVLLRQTGMAIAAGLVYIIVIEGLILGLFASNGVIEAVKKVFPGANAKALGLAFGKIPLSGSATPLVGAGQAVAVLVGYLVVFVGISALLLRRRDVVS
jgi:ABC-type transport system involved in multi-copper enzyme maturation permease subunit